MRKLPLQFSCNVSICTSTVRRNDVNCELSRTTNSCVCYRLFVRSRDTSSKAAAIHERLHDELGVEGRFRLAMQMSELAREFAKAGIRERNPALDEHDVVRQLAAEFYGVTYDANGRR